MNLPFRVKYAIFDENKEVSKKQKELKYKLLWTDLSDILKNVFEGDDNYKWMDRAEASICSIDETKQLRSNIGTIYVDCKKHQHSLHFNQQHTKEYFSIDELKYILSKIKSGLEHFLGYEINEPIIYIEIDTL